MRRFRNSSATLPQDMPLAICQTLMHPSLMHTRIILHLHDASALVQRYCKRVPPTPQGDCLWLSHHLLEEAIIDLRASCFALASHNRTGGFRIRKRNSSLCNGRMRLDKALLMTVERRPVPPAQDTLSKNPCSRSYLLVLRMGMRLTAQTQSCPQVLAMTRRYRYLRLQHRRFHIRLDQKASGRTKMKRQKTASV